MLALTMLPLAGGRSGLAQDAGCTKEQFEAVVEEAATALRNLNQKNKPPFQERLRKLKDKRGWSHDVFMKEAAPFVRDAKIEGFDQATAELLSTIATMGQEGASAQTPDCSMLNELHNRMSVLVGTQTAKWNYMFEKLDAELAK